MSEFKLKTDLMFGPQAVQHIKELPYHQVLVITDGFLESSGAVAKMVQYLPKGASYETYSHVKPDPTQELVDEGVGVLKRVHPDLLIAFGGGSCIDAAKAILFSARDQGLDHPYFIAIPTTAGTGSEVTNFAVITRGEDKVVLIDDFLAPDVAVLDADLTKTVPAKVTVDTGLDVLTHAMEAYVSTTATLFTDALAVRAFRTVLSELPIVVDDGLAMRSRTRMIEASCTAGIAFTNAGLGINHSLAHALGGRFHVAHGRLNAILLPYVMRFHMVETKYREPYECLAHDVGLADADALLAEVLNLRNRLGVEEKLSDLPALDASTFEQELSGIADAAQHDRCTPTSPRPVAQSDLVNLARTAFYGE